MHDKITIADAPDCLNTNDKAMWVLGYQAAIKARRPCLLQIQEPPTKTEALAHYSLQAILAMDEAAPAAAPVVLPEPDAIAMNLMRFVGLDKETARKCQDVVRCVLLAGVSASAAQAVEPFGYVNIHTGQFFKDVEPCRKTNEGHWRTVFTAPQAQADARDAEITWPKARDVGRIGDMSPAAHIRVGFDSDNDVFVSVWDENGGGSIEFCNPGGGGGGQSSRTRIALIALMVAMEADNTEKPSRDWWAQNAAQAAAQGGEHV